MITKQEKRYVKNALWLSHTSLRDFLNCPRAFYFKNVYRDKTTGYKLQIASPHLTLGSLVHDMVKWFLEMQKQVGREQLLVRFDNFWLKYQGKRGGFVSKEEEESFKDRGRKMLESFYDTAKILGKMVPTMDFPKYYLDDMVVLFGNLDYMEELPDGSLHIIDFKTGTKDEEDPLQLHIYAILAEANLQKPVKKISYWYLDRDSEPKEAVLDSLEEKLGYLKQKGREIKKAIEVGEWVCSKSSAPSGAGCFDCQNYQAILDGKGEFQFEDFKFKKMVYFLPR
ncbi:PD-(D/E)XK nuclease family protein [Candidatus Daviesbacteria bacterium]|nr:PD-(D/E)XK nuclease family protein [Candidatus Daviesbacteria bacterium]